MYYRIFVIQQKPTLLLGPYLEGINAHEGFRSSVWAKRSLQFNDGLSWRILFLDNTFDPLFEKERSIQRAL